MINRSSALLAGIAGGLMMEASAVAIYLLGFSRNSMVSYEGCMLTGKTSEAGSLLLLRSFRPLVALLD